MGRPPPNSALAFSGHVQNTCPSAPPLGEPENDCELSNPAQCDLTTGVPAYPREQGENLFCYYQRLFNLVFAGGTPSEYLSKFLNLSELTDVEAARANLGLGDGSPAAGELLIGNGTDFSLATLTPGSGVAITNNNGEIIISAVGGGAASVIVSPAPPGAAVDGDLWWDNTIGQLKIYYTDANSSQWVDASGSGGADLGVTSVTASGVLTSSGGTTPNISLTGVVPIANGGTGASTAAAARAALGLGSAAVQADTFFLQTASNLSDLVDAATARSNLGVSATSDVLLKAGNLSGLTDVAAARLALGLGTMATQDANSVAISGGSIGVSIVSATRYSYPLVSSYPASGAYVLDLSATNRIFLQLTGNTTLTAAGFANEFSLELVATNQSGSPITVSWPAWTEVADTIPTTLEAGQTVYINLSITGATVDTVLASYNAPDTLVKLSYPTSGAIDLEFDSNPNAYIGLTGNATFTASGMAVGRKLTLNLRNTTGASIALTWPAWYPTGTAFPASLGNNESLCVRAECYGTLITDVYAQCFSATSGNVGLLYNVRSYGAIGDGVTDDTAAINLAILALNLTGGSLYFPEGTYLISSLLDQIDDTSLVFGEGPSASVIVQSTGNTGIFHSFQTNRDDLFSIRGLRLSHTSTPNLSSAAAVLVQNEVNAGNDNAPNLTVSNVDIRCDSGSGKAFTYGFQLQNIKNSSFDTYYYTGDNAGGGTSIIYQIYGGGGAGLKCIGSVLANCYATLARTALRVTGSLEGLIVNNCQFVGLTYGLELDYCIHVALTNSHINANWDIYSTGTGGGVDQMNVTNCLLYQTLGSGFRAAVYGPFSRSTFNSNSVVAPDGLANTNGVYITGGSGNTANDNSFFDLQGSYIYFACNDSVARGNVRTYSVGVAATPWVDAGSGNKMGDSIGFTSGPTLAGGSPTETINLDITACNLGKKPDGGSVHVTSDRQVSAQYDWDDGANSATNARIRYFRYDGANLGTGPYRISARFGP